MGRPKKECPLSNAERKRRWQEKHQDSHEERLAERRQKYSKRTMGLSEEDLNQQRELARQRKAKSRANQKENFSRQKIQGLKLKERNRKAKKQTENTPETPKKTSTERVRKHREAMKVRFDFTKTKTKKSTRKETEIQKNVNENISLLDSAEKKASILSSVLKIQSQRSKRIIGRTVGASLLLSPVEKALKRSSKSREKGVMHGRKVLLTTYASMSTPTSSRFVRSRLGASWKSYTQANINTVDAVLSHSKYAYGEKKKDIKLATKRAVTEYYNRDDTSRVLPYKNRTVKVKIDGNVTREPLRVMEKTLKEAYSQFQKENPQIKVGKTSFIKLRPKNVRMKSSAKRLVCGCTYHQNIEYIRKTVSRVLNVNKDNSECFDSNENLCRFILCNDKKICINQKCSKCFNFPKLSSVNISQL